MTRFHKFLPVRNDISTHTLTWSVTATILHYMENHIFQLTRSRGAWHFASGLTNEQLNFNSHAHVERDYTTGAGTAIVFNFNSHAHVERDCKNHAHQTYLQNISTHTLTWSVTCMVCNANPRVTFQLTRSRGAWHDCFDLKCSLMLFQLTRSRGAWLRSTVCSWYGEKFQLTRSRGAWRDGSR